MNIQTLNSLDCCHDPDCPACHGIGYIAPRREAIMREEISWDKFDDLCYALANQIRASGKKYEDIYGIPRGGLVVAVRLSHILGLPLVEEGHIPKMGKTLIVDDICDSGRTLEVWDKSDTAVLHYREAPRFKPTYFADLKREKWIVYPFEV